MNAPAPITLDSRPRWRRRLSVALRRGPVVRAIELGVVAALLAVLAATWLLVGGRSEPAAPLPPPVIAALLVANLVPAMALMVLAARRMALRRAARSPLGGKSRLHVRLVAIFSLIASVPTLLVVIFASLLFQYGAEFWFSDRARGMLENAATIAQDVYREELQRVDRQTTTMSGDLAAYLESAPIDGPLFAQGLAYQLYERNLSEAIIFQMTPEGPQSLALVNPYDRPLERLFTPEMLRGLEGRDSLVVPSDDRVGVLTRLDYGENVYLYAARVFDPQMATQLDRGAAIIADYDTLVSRSRDLQLQFHAALIVVSLLIVAIAIWIAMRVADRMVRPVGQLVDAARRITAGDLSARVPPSRVRDEVGTLGNAFNRMTGRLEAQTRALVGANAQLDSRRAFIEAVLSGVSAGIVSVDEEHRIRLANSSAEELLDTHGAPLAGQKLADVAPELDRQIASEEREEIIQIASHGEPRTLAVKTVQVAGGHVLTFDDITQQLLDQRRAAWSDVARRIAHEIKNPLTPIQLAAERLQRRYGGEVASDPATFEQLTGTIVRQVGDLRRMVDEFSSFARMPKPVFRAEQLGEIARQALFLHEVAHPDIAFSLQAPDDPLLLVCDRRLLGQALTNVVKNAVEAIQQKREEGKGDAGEGDAVRIEIGRDGDRVCVEIVDNGIGLPKERGRLTEPYMTTRAKGTGLGLAIVKKIVEEHLGLIEFGDAPGGGTLVRLVFDAGALARLDAGAHSIPQDKVANG